jgi:hypothetical protein
VEIPPMIIGNSNGTERIPNLTSCASAVAITLPAALNQNRPLSAADIVHYLGFIVLVGFVAYLGAFHTLWVVTRFAGRRSFRTLHRASTAFGVVSALFLPTIYFAHLISPENIFGLIEIGIMITFPFSAFAIAIRILRKGEPLSDTTSAL